MTCMVPAPMYVYSAFSKIKHRILPVKRINVMFPMFTCKIICLVQLNALYKKILISINENIKICEI